MKKSLIAPILGLAVSVVSSHGQGSVFFDNYNSNAGAGAQITYNAASTGLSGPIGGFTAALYYELGTATADPGNDNAVVNVALSALTATGPNAGLTPAYPTSIGNGYFSGPVVTIPGYASGAVTFEIVAFNGANYQASAVRGRSGSFTETSLATGTTPAAYFANNPTFQVFGVPEPTTIALAGLGMAGLLAFRRRN